MNGPGSSAEVVAELARRFQAGDGARAFGLFHRDIRIEQPASLPHGGWHQGHAGVTAMGAAFGCVWSRSIASPRILACGESVVQVTTQTWTALATGRSATVDVVELFSFRDGLVSALPRRWRMSCGPASSPAITGSPPRTSW